MANNALSDFETNSIVDAVRMNDTLRHLDLRSNCLTSGITENIHNLLIETNSLEYLDISLNDFDRDSLVKIFLGLKGNKSLLKLRLSGLGLDDDLLRKLTSTGPICCGNLESLDISDNYLTDDVMPRLCSFIAYNVKITKLWVGGNYFSSEGVLLLLSSLLSISTAPLKQLDVKGASINSDIKKAFMKLKRKHPYLVISGFTGSSFSVVGIDASDLVNTYIRRIKMNHVPGS